MFRPRLSSPLVGLATVAGGTGQRCGSVPDGSARLRECCPPARRRVVVGLIGEQRISNLTMVGGTLVGGLSGIAYNPETDSYVIISDDDAHRIVPRTGCREFRRPSASSAPCGWASAT